MISRKRTSVSVRKLGVLASSALLLQGCASTEELAARDQEAAFYERSIPRCSTDKECQAKWSAARRWVLDHCDFKLEHVTDDFMETFNIQDSASTGVWCRVTKSPENDTTYRIELENGANNWFAQGDLKSRRVDFNRYVKDAWKP